MLWDGSHEKSGEKFFKVFLKVWISIGLGNIWLCFNFQSGGMVCSEVQVDALEKMAISSPTPTTSYGCSLCRSWALLCLIIVINVVADATGLYFIFTLSLLYFTLSLLYLYFIFTNEPVSLFSLPFFSVRKSWEPSSKASQASTLIVCDFHFFTEFPNTYRQWPERNRPLSLECQLVSVNARTVMPAW